MNLKYLAVYSVATADLTLTRLDGKTTYKCNRMNLMSIRQALSRRTTLASCDHTLADLCNVSEKSHRPLGMRSKGYRFSSNSAVVWLYKRLKRVRGTLLPRVFF